MAGIRMNCRFHSWKMPEFFRKYLVPPLPSEQIIEVGNYEEAVSLNQFGRPVQGIDLEEKVFAALVSDALMPYDRLIFHSAAIIIKEKAWLLAAPSGTGKTTQYRNLKKLYPDKVDILCGDNPILIFEGDDRILVHHSPWNGKEGFGTERTAELAGIIFLEQAKENDLLPLPSKKAVIPAFEQIQTFLKTEEQVRKLFELERRLLETVPLYLLRNRGDMASSKILYSMITGQDPGQTKDGQGYEVFN